ncbi:MAG: trypsin-like peptidase domain-containing protein [Ilumatobacteraceae bacterium]
MEPADHLMPATLRRGAPRRRVRRTRLGFVAVVGLVLLAWLAGLLGAVVGSHIVDRRAAPPRTPSMLGIAVAPQRSVAMPALDPGAVAGAVGSSVVAIQRVTADGEVLGESAGTGVIITSDGEILTNAHVVGDAGAVNVRLPGETEPRSGAVVAVDPDNDLALVRIDAADLNTVTFAPADDVRIGDQVLAIGYALDLDGDPTVTLGIVSAVDRSLSTDQGVLGGLVQTDAAISSGNSGGPLLDARGHVVGINTAVASSDADRAATNVGFAIGVAELLRGIDALRAEAGGTESVSGYLGVGLDRRRDGGSGAVVTQVELRSPAADAGLQIEDVIVDIGGERIVGEADAITTIRDRAPGTSVSVGVIRDGEYLDLTATLVARSTD